VKRIITISLLVMVCYIRLSAQLGAIHGQLSYQQYYRDFRFAGGLTKLQTKSPVLDMRMVGNILSPRILSYSLFSSIRANYITTESGDFSYSGSQYSWNRYNLTMKVLPYSPIKLTLAVREYAYDFFSKSYYVTANNGDRQQEQRVSLDVYQISWLPTLSLSYVRNRSFTVKGFPSDIANQTLNFTASGATDTTGAYTLKVTMVDIRDRLYRWYDRFLTMEFSATRSLSEKHGITLNANYEKYIRASVFGFSTQYSGNVANGLHIVTGLGGSNTLSSNLQSRSLSLSQTGSYRINGNYQVGLGIRGYLSNSKTLIGGIGRTDTYRSWATSGNISHRRSFSRITVTNTFMLGFSQQRYTSRFNTLNTALTNNISRSFGAIMFTGNYTLSYVRVRGSSYYDVVDNGAGISLGGMILSRIQSQTDFRYSDTRYPGDDTPYRNQRSFNLMQRFENSFVYYIPVNVGFSGSANWYLTGLAGHTYGWSFSFTSPSFFLSRLSFSYVYSRNFDRYYRREIPEHDGSLSYGWRSLSFTGRFRYVTFPIRTREFQFSVARPF